MSAVSNQANPGPLPPVAPPVEPYNQAQHLILGGVDDQARLIAAEADRPYDRTSGPQTLRAYLDDGTYAEYCMYGRPETEDELDPH